MTKIPEIPTMPAKVSEFRQRQWNNTHIIKHHVEDLIERVEKSEMTDQKQDGKIAIGLILSVATVCAIAYFHSGLTAAGVAGVISTVLSIAAKAKGFL